ncbi:chaplin family protein [Streptomyces sp. NPDC056224]|uniref:chaplin family protein n=1 Tax=Streptomyces sp. NPDC056224 TaxID=3345750 RepID=UPI0035D5F737
MNFVRNRAGNHVRLARTAFWAIARTLEAGGSLWASPLFEQKGKSEIPKALTCGATPAVAGAAADAPGVLGGNPLRIPAAAPVNACGNPGDVIALPKPSFGNTRMNV